MDLRGRRQDITFALCTEWDEGGALSRTSLQVQLAVPIDGRWHQRWDGQGEQGALPDGLRALLDGATGLVIDGSSILMVFPPCLDDLDPHVARLEQWLAVAARLSGRGDGYR
jgi:hypothetical protein